LQHQISLFLPTPQYRAVEKLAHEEQVTFSAAIRRIIDLGLDARRKINAKKDD
jgi:hypothetical protein